MKHPNDTIPADTIIAAIENPSDSRLRHAIARMSSDSPLLDPVTPTGQKIIKRTTTRALRPAWKFRDDTKRMKPSILDRVIRNSVDAAVDAEDDTVAITTAPLHRSDDPFFTLKPAPDAPICAIVETREVSGPRPGDIVWIDDSVIVPPDMVEEAGKQIESLSRKWYTTIIEDAKRAKERITAAEAKQKLDKQDRMLRHQDSWDWDLGASHQRSRDFS